MHKTYSYKLVTLAPDQGNKQGYTPNILVESRKYEASGAIPRPIKQVTRTTIKREPVGIYFKKY